MSVRTMARFHRDPTEHTSWCTRDHRCGINEHRSADLITDGIGGRAVITRVRAGNTEYAEIRARIPLHSTEIGARWQLSALLSGLDRLLSAVAIRRGVIRTRTDRPAIDRRTAA